MSSAGGAPESILWIGHDGVMEIHDSVALAEAQVALVLEEGGVMTLRRLGEIVDGWTESEDASEVMAGVWSGVVDD